MPATLLGASVMGLVLSAGTKSLRGEFLVAAAFASVHGPVAASGAAGANGDHGAGPAFALATLSVHALKARFQARKEKPVTRRSRVVVLAPGVAAVVLVLAMAAVAAQHPLAVLVRAF